MIRWSIFMPGTMLGFYAAFSDNLAHPCSLLWQIKAGMSEV